MNEKMPDDGAQTATTCDVCGASFVPLSTIHTERQCQKCGKTTYVAEPGENGQGIQVREGDRLIIPPGALRIPLSLDRSQSTSRFTRAGVSWLAHALLFAGAPESADDLDQLFGCYTDEFEAALILASGAIWRA